MLTTRVSPEGGTCTNFQRPIQKATVAMPISTPGSPKATCGPYCPDGAHACEWQRGGDCSVASCAQLALGWEPPAWAYLGQQDGRDERGGEGAQVDREVKVAEDLGEQVLVGRAELVAHVGRDARLDAARAD